jgi:hypothetical protein
MFGKKICFGLCLLIVTCALQLTAQNVRSGSITGNLWVVPVSQAASVAFPAPIATPDATFTTNGMTYIGQYITTSPAAHCFTIAKFLGGCPTIAYNLKFSGLTNPNLGGVVSETTPMGGTNYGVLIEFSGNINLTNGQEITILHDDGVSLEIDDVPVSGFSNGVNVPLLESVIGYCSSRSCSRCSDMGCVTSSAYSTCGRTGFGDYESPFCPKTRRWRHYDAM